METTTKQSQLITFGKHNGKTLEQIAQEDMNWVIWFSKNYNVYSNFSPNPYVKLKQETISSRLSLLNEAKTIASEHFSKIEQSNKETSNSEWVGTIRKRQTFKLTVNSIRQSFNYTVIIATTPENNKIKFYDKGFNFEPNQLIEVVGTPTKHIESLGVKMTYINRVNLL